MAVFISLARPGVAHGGSSQLCRQDGHRGSSVGALCASLAPCSAGLDKLCRRGVKGRLWPREALISRCLPLGMVYQSNKVGGLGPRRERRPLPRAELHERWAGFTSPMRSPPWLRGTRWSRVNARPCVGGKFISIAPPHNQHTAKAGSRSSLRRQLVTFLRHEWEKA